MPERCLQNKFEAFPWRDAPEDLDMETGQTGYLIVDAGMRELARTGFMHNRYADDLHLVFDQALAH